MDQQARQSQSNSQSTPVVVWNELQSIGSPHSSGKQFYTAKVSRKPKDGKEGNSREYSAKKCTDSIIDFFESRSRTMKAAGKKAVSFRRMFRLHAKRCTTLTSCPYISGVIAVVLEDRHFALLSKWKEKGSIKRYIEAVNGNEQEALSWKSVYRVAIDTILALDYIHKGDEVHGNLKSSNILLGDRGGATLLAADIRFFFRSDDESDDLSDFKVDFEDSYLPYCPLETLARSELTKESDIYNFGMCLYELICFENPYTNLTKQEIMEQIKSGNPLLIKNLKKSKAPKSLLILTKYCLSPKRSYRPTSENVARFLEENKDAIENETDSLNALYLLDPRYAQKSNEEYLGEAQPTEQDHGDANEHEPMPAKRDGKHPALSVHIPTVSDTNRDGSTPKSALEAIKRARVPEPKSPIKSRPLVPIADSKLRIDPPPKAPNSPTSPSRNPRDLSPDSQDPLFNHPGRSPSYHRPATAPNPVIEREFVPKSQAFADDLKVEELNISEDQIAVGYVQPKILGYSTRATKVDDSPPLSKTREVTNQASHISLSGLSDRDIVGQSDADQLKKSSLVAQQKSDADGNPHMNVESCEQASMSASAPRAFNPLTTNASRPQHEQGQPYVAVYESALPASHELQSSISIDNSAPIQPQRTEVDKDIDQNVDISEAGHTHSHALHEGTLIPNDPPTPLHNPDAKSLDQFIDLNKYPNPFSDDEPKRPDTAASVGSVVFDLRNSMSMTQLGLSQIAIHERSRDFAISASEFADQNDENKGYYPSFVPRTDTKIGQTVHEAHQGEFLRDQDSMYNTAPDLSNVIFDEEAPTQPKSISTEFSDGVPIAPSRASSDIIFQKTSQFKQGDYGLTYVNKMNETQLVEFLKSPVPKGFTIYGHIRRTPDKNGYHFFIECGNEQTPINRLCAVAITQSKMGSMSMSISSVVDGDVHCGVLKSNMMRNHFKYYDVDSPQKVSIDIRYFSTCPRKTKVALSICKDRPATQLVNKMPVLVGSVYTLDFSQRVTERSLRNVQLCGPDNGVVLLQFGKNLGDRYALDFSYPFTSLEAFIFSLTSFFAVTV